jgi:hypothetical protein
MTDIAELNLRAAHGLPGAETLDVGHCLDRLDAWARLVASKTDRWLPRFHRAPAEFDGSLPKFRMLALVTVLQRDLGVCYNPRCVEGPYCALDPRTLFLHGLLDGHGGTCATMPVLYVAVGRRLSYPLHLVHAGEHFFVRWEEPGGERFNIEATATSFVPRDDEHYRRWPKPIRDEDVRSGFFLRNLAPQEELAAFLRLRGQCWLDHLQTAAALEAFGRAAGLRPRLPGLDCVSAVAAVIHHVVERLGRETVLQMEPRDIPFLLLEQPCDPRLASLAVDELKRIIENYRERRMLVPADNQAVSCHA